MAPVLTLMVYIQTRIARRDEDGIVAAEYVLMGTVILIAVIAAATAFSGELKGLWADLLK